MKRISPKEAVALLDQGWTYLDVRSEGEYAQAHPAGAVNIPLMHMGPGGMRPNDQFLSVVKAAFPKSSLGIKHPCRGPEQANTFRSL